MIQRLSFCLLLIIHVVSLCEAVQTRKLETTGLAAFSKGKFSNVEITSDGFVQPGFSVVKEYQLPEDTIYCMKKYKDSLYLGTGPNGRIYQCATDGSTKVILDSPEQSILCMTIDAQGTLYAGTGPDGIIYKIKKNGDAVTYAQTHEKYVWSLSFDGSGRLLATTGIPGKLYRIAEKDSLDLLFASNEEHLLRILPYKGEYLIGSSGNGVVYRMNAKGAITPFFQAEQNEIHDIAVFPSALVIATIMTIAGKEQTPPQPNDCIYRYDDSGSITTLWKSKDQRLFGILPVSNQELIVAYGNNGNLGKLTDRGVFSLLVNELGGAVSDMTLDNATLWITLYNPAKLLKCTTANTSPGWYESEVMDTVSAARWGVMETRGRGIKGEFVTFQCRSGNTKTPDQFWSPWSAIDDSRAVTCPPARFIQWRANFKVTNEKVVPAVSYVSISYATPNHIPELTGVTIYPFAKGYFEKNPPPQTKVFTQNVSAGLRIQYILSDSEPEGLSKGRWMQLRELRTIGWDVQDPDNDMIASHLYYRPAQTSNWLPFATYLEEKYYTIDTSILSDGIYDIRVVVDDSPSNSVQTVLQSQLIAATPLIVDRTPPDISQFKVEKTAPNSAVVTCLCNDALGILTKAEVMYDNERWFLVDPVDGLCDTRKESFSVTVTSPKGVIEALYFKITDENQNTAIANWP